MSRLPVVLAQRLQAVLALQEAPGSVEDLAQLWQAKGGLTDPSRLWSRHLTPHAVTSSERRGWACCILDVLALPFLDGQRVDRQHDPAGWRSRRGARQTQRPPRNARKGDGRRGQAEPGDASG